MRQQQVSNETTIESASTNELETTTKTSTANYEDDDNASNETNEDQEEKPQENVRNSVAIEPEQQENSILSSSITSHERQSNHQNDSTILDQSKLFDQEDGEDERDGESSELADAELSMSNDQLSRRVHLINFKRPNGGSSKSGQGALSNELKNQLKSQKAKLLERASHLKNRKNRKRKRANQSQPEQSANQASRKLSGSAKSRPMQTRQTSASSNFGYPSLDSGLSGALNQRPPITSTIRQHLPSLPSSFQISSAVQKLLMNKFGANSQQPTMAGSMGGRLKDYQHQELPQLDMSSTIANIPIQSISPSVSSSLAAEDNRLADLLHQWAPSEMEPSTAMIPTNGYAQMTSASTNHKYPIQAASHQTKITTAANNKLIPIEIIGLDPSVTNTILYGAQQGEGASGQSAGDQIPSIYRPDSESSQLHQTIGKDGVPSGPYGQPKPSSIFHIHHFHHTKVSQPAQEGVGSNTTEEQQTELQQPARLQQQISLADGGGGSGPTEAPNDAQAGSSQDMKHQQQVALNEKGELLYAPIEHQGPGGDSNSVSDEPQEAQTSAKSRGQPQTMQVIHTSSTISDHNEHQQMIEQPPHQSVSMQTEPDHQVAYQNQGQVEPSSGLESSEGPQGQHQVVPMRNQTLLSAFHQPAIMYANSANLRNLRHQANDPRAQIPSYEPPGGGGGKKRVVYVTPNGQMVHLVDQNELAAGHSQLTELAEPGGGHQKQSQNLLMVAYRPQYEQQVASNQTSHTTQTFEGQATEAELQTPAVQRNPYNEGSESKAFSVAATKTAMALADNHLLRGANSLLKPFVGLESVKDPDQQLAAIMQMRRPLQLATDYRGGATNRTNPDHGSAFESGKFIMLQHHTNQA